MSVRRTLRTMDDIPLDGKRVIVRVDFNISTSGEVVAPEEDYRMEAAMNTIQELRRRRCIVLLMTHRGNPKEDKNDTNIEPIRQHLQEMLRDDVRKLPKLHGQEVESIIAGLEPGSVALYPNVRLDEREMNINEKFGKEIADVADAYVSEAFSVAHRAHTSVALLPQLLPSAAGRHTVVEIEKLTQLREHARRPYVAIVSGAKIVTKVGMLRQLLGKVDTLCVGGQIANIFLMAKNAWRGPFNADEVEAARSIMEIAGPKLLLPVDVVVGNEDGSGATEVAVDSIPAEVKNLWDIGPDSAHAIIKVCRTANTVMWNGPVGRFEVPAYSLATKAIAQGLADVSAYRVVGGGDTVNALEQLKLMEKYDHVSVGGGAMVAFLENKRMPGLEPLYTENG